MRASLYGQKWDLIFGIRAFLLAAGRATIMGDDDPNLIYTIVLLKIRECLGRVGMNREVSTAAYTGIGGVR